MTPRSAKGHPLLAVALAAETTDDALRTLDTCAPLADIAEVRLDLMRSYDLSRLLGASPLPLIVTLRPPREGGRYAGDEPSRLAILAEAMALGAAYVDVEGDAVASLRARHGDAAPTGLIVSCHDFTGMPADLAARHHDLAASAPGAIPKVVGMARGAADAAPVLALLARAAMPTIAIAMGPAGLASRVLALRHRATFLTFAAPPEQRGVSTAPGQVTLDAMHAVFHARSIGSLTLPVGLLCAAVDLPLLALYNRLLREAGADAVCVPLPLAGAPEVDGVLQAFAPLGMDTFLIAPEARHLAIQGRAVSVLASAPEIDIICRDEGRFVGRWWGGAPQRQVGALLARVRRPRPGDGKE